MIFGQPYQKYVHCITLNLLLQPNPSPLRHSCSVRLQLREQHVRSSGERPVPLHASAPASAPAAAASSQQRPALQLLLRLRICPQHVPEQLSFLTQLRTAAELVPGLQQHRRVARGGPRLCSRGLRLLWSVNYTTFMLFSITMLKLLYIPPFYFLFLNRFSSFLSRSLELDQ